MQRFALGDAVWNPAPWKPRRITVTGPWAVTLPSLGTFFDSGVRSHPHLEFFRRTAAALLPRVIWPVAWRVEPEV